LGKYIINNTFDKNSYYFGQVGVFMKTADNRKRTMNSDDNSSENQIKLWTPATCRYEAVEATTGTLIKES